MNIIDGNKFIEELEAIQRHHLDVVDDGRLESVLLNLINEIQKCVEKSMIISKEKV